MSRESLIYVSRPTVLLTDAVTSTIFRADDLLFRPSLSITTGTTFGTGTIDVAVGLVKGITTPGLPVAPFVNVATGIAVATLVELPVCFGVQVTVNTPDGTTAIVINLSGIAYTSHPDGLTQGP